ncbi:hypothetical protein KAU11_04190 [Candidatus Babeliales bacterium]|nr:hypothetical protein [Candidatus Babeliales bacterium]
MAKKPFEIRIDMEKKCKGCGEAGAGGYCLACVAKRIKEGKYDYDHIIKPIKDAVKNARRPIMAKDEKPKEETFPKIAAKAKVKSYERLKDDLKLKFDKLTFSTTQKEQLDDWIDYEEEVIVTIQAVTSTMK